MDKVAGLRSTDKHELRIRGVKFEAIGKTGTRIAERFDVEWTEAAIRGAFPDAHAVDKSAQQLWSAATYQPDATRGLAGLVELHALLLDYDSGDFGELDRVCDALAADGFAYWVYSAWSHRDPTKVHAASGKVGPFDSFRLVLPLSRAVTPDEYRRLAPRVYGVEVPANPPHYATELLPGMGRKAPRGWDAVGERPSQGFYAPVTRGNASEVFEVHAGKPLDAAAILARYLPSDVRADRTRRAVGAPGACKAFTAESVVAALATVGVHANGEPKRGYRAPCPSCAPSGAQRSPSFVFGPARKGVSLTCFAGCSGEELVDALGLGEVVELREADANTHVREAWATVPATPAVPLDDARGQLPQLINNALDQRTAPTAIAFPTGAGKTWAIATDVVPNRIRKGRKLAVLQPTHAVIRETWALLPEDVKARAVWLHTPIEPSHAGAVCTQVEETQRLLGLGVGQHTICKHHCRRYGNPQQCGAFAEWTAKQSAKESAALVLAAHAAVGQLFDDEGGGLDRELVVDEMPSAFDTIEVNETELDDLADRPLRGVDAWLGALVAVLAKLVLADAATLDGAEVAVAGGKQPAADVLASIGDDCVFSDEPTDPDRHRLVAARRLLAFWRARRSGAQVTKRPKSATEPAARIAWAPGAVLAALRATRGVLLSATPNYAALGDQGIGRPAFAVHEVRIADPAVVDPDGDASEHERILVPLATAGGQAMAKRVADCDWTWIQQWARAAVLAAARRVPGGEAGLRAAPDRGAGLGAHKGVADAIRQDPKVLGDVAWAYECGALAIIHFGASAGLNAFQDRTAICVLGTYNAMFYEEGVQLGVANPWAHQAARAAADASQLLGRLRPLGAAEGKWLCYVGGTCPTGWDATNSAVRGDRELAEEAHGVLRAVLWFGRSKADVATACGVSDTIVSRWARRSEPTPGERLGGLHAMLPSLGEGIGLLATPVQAQGERPRDYTKRCAAHEARARQVATLIDAEWATVYVGVAKAA